MSELRERVKKILENHVFIRFVEGVTDEILAIFQGDSNVDYSDYNYAYTPDRDCTKRMDACHHKFRIMESSGMNNGHGCPTWKCIFCGYKKISM